MAAAATDCLYEFFAVLPKPRNLFLDHHARDHDTQRDGNRRKANLGRDDEAVSRQVDSGGRLRHRRVRSNSYGHRHPTRRHDGKHRLASHRWNPLSIPIHWRIYVHGVEKSCRPRRGLTLRAITSTSWDKFLLFAGLLDEVEDEVTIKPGLQTQK